MLCVTSFLSLLAEAHAASIPVASTEDPHRPTKRTAVVRMYSMSKEPIHVVSRHKLAAGRMTTDWPGGIVRDRWSCRGMNRRIPPGISLLTKIHARKTACPARRAGIDVADINWKVLMSTLKRRLPVSGTSRWAGGLVGGYPVLGLGRLACSTLDCNEQLRMRAVFQLLGDWPPIGAWRRRRLSALEACSL